MQEFGRRRPSTLLLPSPDEEVSSAFGDGGVGVGGRPSLLLPSPSAALTSSGISLEEAEASLCWPDNCVFCGVDYETGTKRKMYLRYHLRPAARELIKVAISRF